MDLGLIREYVQKTAEIISTVAEMQVLICNLGKEIVGDSKDGITNNGKLPHLTDNSMLSKTVDQRKMMIVEDSKNNYPGCKRCPEKVNCDVNAMISIPVIDGEELYGAIGLYAHEKEDVKRLMEKYKDFLAFTHRMSELLIMKSKEESKTIKLKERVEELQNNNCNLPFDDIIGSSRAIKAVKNEAMKFAKGTANILIQGESGTGKEVFARAIHTASRNSAGPFIAINCAALPENLIESELFGYEEGAFTGARKGGKLGKFELAHHGTLFLDEIGELPIHLQAKLLRTLQERKIQRVGGTKEISIDVRIISATNQNLEELSKNGQFREDLFYRLNVIPIQLPPLRERRSDIGELSDHFLRIYAKALHKDLFGFDKEVVNLLYDYSWPGNIRELQNAIEYAVNISSGTYIRVEDLPKKLAGRREDSERGLSLRPLRLIEDEYIQEAVRIYGNSLNGKMKAAQVLGISKATLYRRLKEIREEKNI